MKAMVLAAGMGTRLQHYTESKPKALVEVNGKPLIALIIGKLVRSGFSDIVVNVHHFSDQVVDYLSNNNFGAKIHISDESDRLLDTGGGIIKASHFLQGDNPFLVHNVDILSDIDLKMLLASHQSNNSLATLAVSNRKSSRKFLFDNDMRLSGWKNFITEKQIIPRPGLGHLQEFAFAGIHFINPLFFELVQSKGTFSIVEAYLNLCKSQVISGFDASSNYVLDVGKIQSLDEATEFIKNQR